MFSVDLLEHLRHVLGARLLFARKGDCFEMLSTGVAVFVFLIRDGLHLLARYSARNRLCVRLLVIGEVARAALSLDLTKQLLFEIRVFQVWISLIPGIFEVGLSEVRVIFGVGCELLSRGYVLTLAQVGEGGLLLV